MLLTWLYYLKHNSSKVEKAKVPSFFVHPIKQNKFTLIKSPMAHKTFSQEQFMYKFYKLTISFSNNKNNSLKSNLKSCNEALLFALFLRKSFKCFETNFFFLKRIKFNFNISDVRFLKVF